jgi:2-keto-4-pentenoate hydratase/2-oxohepta-3-ene-1,7-dioic acid hydratase in catechol pathway
MGRRLKFHSPATAPIWGAIGHRRWPPGEQHQGRRRPPKYIFGYMAAQDINDRTLQDSEPQWTRCRSFDTFTPLGPFIETKIEPHSLKIQLYQNGQLRQNSNTSQLLFNCFELVSFISTRLTLLPGDIILTGTPGGVGPIQSGDRLEVRIQGLTHLVNPVKSNGI